MHKILFLIICFFSLNLYSAEFYAIIGGKNQNFHIGDTNQNNTPNTPSLVNNFSFDFNNDPWNITTTKSFVEQNNTSNCSDTFTDTMIQLSGGSSTYPCNIYIGFTPNNSSTNIGIDDNLTMRFYLYLEQPNASNSRSSLVIGNLLNISWAGIGNNPTINFAGQVIQVNSNVITGGFTGRIEKNGRNLIFYIRDIEYFNIDLSSETSFNYHYSNLQASVRFGFINVRTLVTTHDIVN